VVLLHRSGPLFMFRQQLALCPASVYLSSMFQNVTSLTLSVNVESPQCALMAPKGTDILSPTQCRAARAGLNISAPELAELAEVTRQTISRFETGRTSPIAATVRQIRNALEKAGAEFPDLHTVRFPPKDGGAAC
jgi:DNA-binding transcriptional regulator YiaG